MTPRKFLVVLAVLVAGCIAFYVATTNHAAALVLTGTVDANQVVVSPQITGRLEKLLVVEGDHVRAGQWIAQLDPSDLEAAAAAAQAAAAAARAKAAQARSDWEMAVQALPTQVAQARAQVAAAQAALAAARAHAQQSAADYRRAAPLVAAGIEARQALDAARAARDADAASARADQRNVQAAQAALANASAQQLQIRSLHDALAAARRAAAQSEQAYKQAQVQLGYTHILAPIDGVVGLRIARQGEVVPAGGGIVTLIDLRDTWVRADMPETYADRLQLGEPLVIRLPSGRRITGRVSYKAADADFATERDVSRTKRDIRTVQFRVAVPNPGEEMTLGSTAFVVLPFAPTTSGD